MIKRFARCALFFLAVVFLISACASPDEATTEQSTSQTTGTVPGEKMSDEGRVTPGAAGSSASVHW
jgi:ABC-type glycerol-3-phosphate transport system substrate-binding protein